MPSCWPSKKTKKKLVSSSSSSLADDSKKSISSKSLITQYIESHPFEAAKILQQIFSFIPINDLLLTRQVCKRWNTSSCYILRRKIEGCIILQRGLSYYSRAMSPSLDIPIGRLFLKIDDMEDLSAIRFFQTVGHSIIFLVLNLEGSSLAGFLSQVHHLKNLHQLSLNLFQEDSEYSDKSKKKRAQSIKIFIEDYITNTAQDKKQILPHLDSFVLSCEPEWKTNEALLLEKLLEMSPSLKNLNLLKWPFILKPNLFQNCEFENLKFLNLKLLDDQGFSILGKKSLKNLKTVEFELARDVGQDSFINFLENVGSTLEYLEVKSQHDATLGFKIPVQMKELNTIRLHCWVGPIYLDSVLGNCPKLEKLQLSHVSPSDIFVKEPPKPLPSVRYLAINFGSGGHAMKKTFKMLRNFVQAFPLLKIFMMKKVSDKIMEIVCDGWKELEALRITTSFALSDSGITGLHYGALQQGMKQREKGQRLGCGCNVPLNVNEGKVDFQGARVAPHIGMLKELKDLRIESEQGTNWPLTNMSLHLGLSELRPLNSLKLTCNELGPHWCLRCIADNLPNLQHLTIMDRAISHDRYDEQELHYLLRKLPKLNLIFAEADSFSRKRQE